MLRLYSLPDPVGFLDASKTLLRHLMAVATTNETTHAEPRERTFGGRIASAVSRRQTAARNSDMSFRRQTSQAKRTSGALRGSVLDVLTEGAAAGDRTSTHSQYLHLLPFFHEVSPQLAAFIAASTANGNLGAEDIYFWATIAGHHELALLFWPLCKDPLAVALLGADICRTAASKLHRLKVPRERSTEPAQPPLPPEPAQPTPLCILTSACTTPTVTLPRTKVAISGALSSNPRHDAHPPSLP